MKFRGNLTGFILKDIKSARNRVKQDLFKLCLIRNVEMNNNLSISSSTALQISGKNGAIFTVNNLPKYTYFSTPGWVIMRAQTNTGDPDPDGNYVCYNFCTINDINKTITLGAGNPLSHWDVGNKIILYNAFLNYTLPDNQDLDAFIPVSGAPVWRAFQTYPGPIFKHSDGRYIAMFVGFANGSGPTYIGYKESIDNGQTWTIGNSGNYVFSFSTIPNTRFGMLPGLANTLPDGRYYCSCVLVRDSDSKNLPTIMYFDEDLTTFTFSGALISDNFGIGSITEIENEYHMLGLYIHPGGATERVLRAYKSSTLEGTYTKYQDIASGVTANNGQAWSYSCGVATIIKDGNNIHALMDATSQWTDSGTKGNRELVLLNWNTTTKLWEFDSKGPVILNPMYYWNIDGSYEWYTEHGGPHASFGKLDNYCYLMPTFNGQSTYNSALLKLNINLHAIHK